MPGDEAGSEGSAVETAGAAALVGGEGENHPGDANEGGGGVKVYVAIYFGLGHGGVCLGVFKTAGEAFGKLVEEMDDLPETVYPIVMENEDDDVVQYSTDGVMLAKVCERDVKEGA